MSVFDDLSNAGVYSKIGFVDLLKNEKWNFLFFYFFYISKTIDPNQILPSKSSVSHQNTPRNMYYSPIMIKMSLKIAICPGGQIKSLTKSLTKLLTIL